MIERLVTSHLLGATSLVMLCLLYMNKSVVANAAAGLGGVLTFMFERTDDFQEIIEFGRLSDTLYGLKVNKLQGDFKPGLAAFISQHSIRAILIGTRRSESPPRLPAIILDVFKYFRKFEILRPRQPNLAPLLCACAERPICAPGRQQIHYRAHRCSNRRLWRMWA